MIHNSINHWNERPIRLIAESLRISWVNCKLNKGAIIRRHLGFPWSQAPLGRNMGSCRGRGEISRWGVAKKSEQCYRGVTDSFKVDLPDLKFFIYFFLIPCMEKHKTGILLHRHPKRSPFNFESKNQRYKTEGPDPNKDLINCKLKYWTREARLILQSGIYIFCYQYFGRQGLPSSALGSYIQWYGLS